MNLTDSELYLLQICGSGLASKDEICDHYAIKQEEFVNEMQTLTTNGLAEKIPDILEISDGIFIPTAKGWEIINKIWGES